MNWRDGQRRRPCHESREREREREKYHVGIRSPAVMPAVKSTYRRAVHLHRSRRRLHALSPLHIFKNVRKEA